VRRFRSASATSSADAGLATTEAAVARVLPPPLQPTSDVVLAHIYRMNDTTGSGRTANPIFPSAPGSLRPTSAAAIRRISFILRRRRRSRPEFHGQPKNSASPGSTPRHLVVGIVARTDRRPHRHDGYKQRRDALSSLSRHFDFAENINLKAIDIRWHARSAAHGAAVGRCSVHECWSALHRRLRPSQAPITGSRRGNVDGFHCAPISRWWRTVL